MSTTLEQRVATLEEELNNLKKVIGVARTDKDWRNTFGMSADDAGFDEMIQLGAEIRSQDKQDED